MSKRGPEREATLKAAKGFLIGLVTCGLIGGAIALFSMKGLYLLPDKVCDGAVQRDIAIQSLPRARAAEEHSNQGGTGDKFDFYCNVSTSGDSILSGMVDLRDTPRSAWEEHYGSLAGNHVIRVTRGGIEALTQTDDDSAISSVYVSCQPRNMKEDAGKQEYALIAEVNVTGKSRATGGELRQALTDFAYQLTRHAYKLAECKEPRSFPEALPRYEED
ncbi:hypothetical protein [Streptomyces sp. AK04-3B]|uniref:hypothetical protein n=1 Tax=Streptomyces sp. AK04-3B TaxID=3028650 RepID=UPI0029B5154D|nr:hypothetical protein [Streptomyces sp. AK04-3B]MDX3803508.1 hypothetical protein [Streptomyces sp. AK04-3B]